MPRIEIHHLQTLADRPTGKSYLGELIRRLVYATTAKQQPSLHFLSGETNGYAGWDGWVEVNYEENGNIRRHRSLWELSTDREFERKFKRDFKSAETKTLPHGWSKSDVVYVGLTLRSVTSEALPIIKNKFSATERAKWGGIVLLAADDLAQWIEKLPSVEDWATEEFQVGSGRFGRALEHWFSAWSNQSTPSVTEQLLTAGRDLSKVTSAFRAETGSATTLLCDSTEEAIALIYCAIKTLSEPDAQLVMATSLVVENEGNADRLANQPLSPLGMPTVVLAPPATKHRNRLIQAGYRVLEVLGRANDSSNVIRFERASVQDFSAALEGSMGFTSENAEVTARSVGSSVSIWHIRSLFSNNQQPTLPVWADGQNTDAVLAAVFAGAWREDSSRDMEVVCALAGTDEARLSGALSQYASCATPLLEIIGVNRFVVAPTAAFEFIYRGITKHHIARLSNAVSSVFNGTSTAVDQHWLGLPQAVTSRNPLTEISNGLRDGLAETLLRIAVLGAPLVKSGALQGHSSAQSYVDQLVRQLDGLSTDPRILASLDRQLPVLIEAAPSPFLDALDALIQGDTQGLCLMLADEAGVFGRSFHTGLLWGLEALAWSTDLLPRVAHILAALARIDDGGHISNRPFRSLCEIFLPWHPGTSCDPGTRTAVLRSVIEREPEVGWKLLVALLPGKRSMSMQTHRPKWRSLGQLDRRSIKRNELFEAYDLTILLTFQVAGSDPSKLADLIEHYPNLNHQQKATLEDALRSASQSIAPPAELQRLWSRIEKLCRHHASFASTDWALPKQDLKRLQVIADGFALNDPVLKHRWLFDEQFPDLGTRDDDYDERTRVLQTRRRAALQEVLNLNGWDGVHKLISTVTYQYIVGNEVGLLPSKDIEVLDAMNIWQSQDVPEWMAFRSASCSRVSVKGENWTAHLLGYASTHNWQPTSVAMALLDYPDQKQTYETVHGLGENVSKEYWTRRSGYLSGAREDLKAFESAVDEFVKWGRAADLIDKNWNDIPKLGYERVLKIVDAFIAQPPDAEKILSLGAIQHDLQSVFDWLRKHPAVDIEALARREYTLLPLLTSHGLVRGELSLHELLRRQPEFFVDVVCDLYRPASTDRELPVEDVETAKLRAHVAYELLDSWRTPPGVEDGLIDVGKLGEWVDAARKQLSAKDREEVGDQTIGKLLYHLPADKDDGAFPPRALRVLLERWRSDELELGMEIESFNSRGVYSRNIDEGGRQERELAAGWQRDAETVGSSWPRARALCLRIAESWNRHAEAEDLDAQRDRAKRSR
jgi:hypothetical protein